MEEQGWPLDRGDDRNLLVALEANMLVGRILSKASPISTFHYFGSQVFLKTGLNNDIVFGMN